MCWILWVCVVWLCAANLVGLIDAASKSKRHMHNGTLPVWPAVWVCLWLYHIGAYSSRFSREQASDGKMMSYTITKEQAARLESGDSVSFLFVLIFRMVRSWLSWNCATGNYPDSRGQIRHWVCSAWSTHQSRCVSTLDQRLRWICAESSQDKESCYWWNWRTRKCMSTASVHYVDSYEFWRPL
jgi:hypothetical protein